MAIEAEPATLRWRTLPLPERESYSSLTTYEYCPRRYAFRYVERLPGEFPPGQFAFGSVPSTRRSRSSSASDPSPRRRAPEPGLDVLRRACDEVLARAGLEPDELARMRAAAGPVLERFLRREEASASVPVAAELGFGLDVALPADSGSVRFVGYVDRVDRARTAPPSSPTTRPGGPAARRRSTPTGS
jgi:RecB family exonuclease